LPSGKVTVISDRGFAGKTLVVNVELARSKFTGDSFLVLGQKTVEYVDTMLQERWGVGGLNLHSNYQPCRRP
jgi:hypothetical protein